MYLTMVEIQPLGKPGYWSMRSLLRNNATMKKKIDHQTFWVKSTHDVMLLPQLFAYLFLFIQLENKQTLDGFQ